MFRGSIWIHFCFRWIVSAAHCFYDESSKVENIVATVAAHGWKHDGEVYKILQRVNHPKFSRDSGNKEYDLALLQTVQPIAFHEKVQPIPISKQWIPEGDKGMFAGWGLSNVCILPHITFKNSKFVWFSIKFGILTEWSTPFLFEIHWNGNYFKWRVQNDT